MDPAVVEACIELYDEEWQALKAIYPELIPTEIPPIPDEVICLSIPVTFPRLRPVFLPVATNDSTEPTVKVGSLPPIRFSLSLCPTYPLEAPPMIQAIQSEKNWLPIECIQKLEHILSDMWVEGEPVLDRWIDFIQSGEELLSSLGCLDSATRSIRVSETALQSLMSHNQSYLAAEFDTSKHPCPICLDRLSGTLCLQLSPCNHVTCKGCLKAYWGKYIAEGHVTRVGCPHPECVKQSSQICKEEAESILDEEQMARWRFLLEKLETESDPNVTYCPHHSCQRPVKSPPPSTDGPEWDRLRTCECGYTFCVHCRRAWHGPHTPCPEIPAFVAEYLRYPTGSEQRKAVEKRHGRANVLSWVESRINLEWKEQETKPCPGCKVRIQKSDGCNHITCSRCQHHFCYNCGVSLDSVDVYSHFRPRMDGSMRLVKTCSLFGKR